MRATSYDIRRAAKRAEWAGKPNSVPLTRRIGLRPTAAKRPVSRRETRCAKGGDHSSRPAVADGLVRPTRGCIASRAGSSPPIWACWRWGLPCHGCRQPCGALLPHHFTLACDATSRPASIGGVVSVALSLGSLPVAVSHHRALSSSDFPPLARRRGLRPPLYRRGPREARGGVSRAAAWPTLPLTFYHRRIDPPAVRRRARNACVP